MFRKLLIAVNAVLAVAIGIQLLGFTATTREYTMASWKDRPDSVEATTDLSDNVVTAKVLKIRPSEIRMQAEGEPGGVETIPAEIVTMQVMDDDAKGNKKGGDTIEVFHTGRSKVKPTAYRSDMPKGQPPPKPEGYSGSDKPSAARPGRDANMSVPFSALMDDPGYEVGEEYVLFLREGPTLEGTKTMGIISPEGRWKKDARGNVQPMSDKGWAKQMRGKSAAELKGKARDHAKGKAGGKGAG